MYVHVNSHYTQKMKEERLRREEEWQDKLEHTMQQKHEMLSKRSEGMHKHILSII